MIRTAVVIAVTAVTTAVAFQQVPREIILRPSNATLGEPFTSLYSVRELADGRVLISDYSSDNRVVVADMVSGRVRRVGNVGAGPREYRRAGRLFALPGDSTLLIDSPDRGRWWLLMHHDSIVRNVAPDLPVLRIVGGNPAGVDDRGRVLGVKSALASEKLAHNRIRLQLIAIIGERNGAKADTIARLRGDEHQITQVGTRQRPFWFQTQLSGSVADQALMFRDGWVAVVRVKPYRIEWLTPSGTWIRGPELFWEWPRADAREKAAAFERLKRRIGDRAKEDDRPWADRLAPVRTNSMIAAPDGKLFVLRAQWSKEPDTRYDVFDRTGQRIGQLALPDSERVVGFGLRSVYVSVRDGDGFHHLRRHPWP